MAITHPTQLDFVEIYHEVRRCQKHVAVHHGRACTTFVVDDWVDDNILMSRVMKAKRELVTAAKVAEVLCPTK